MEQQRALCKPYKSSWQEVFLSAAVPVPPLLPFALYVHVLWAHSGLGGI